MIPAGSAAPEIGLLLPPQEDLVLAIVNEPADAWMAISAPSQKQTFKCGPAKVGG